MPEYGLPKGLCTLLRSLVDNHDLKGWQIYDENGSVAMKIRFKNDDNKGNISKPMNKSCKAKSNAQITRDKMRSEQYHVEKRVTRSQTLHNEEIESAHRVNYIESAGEPKHHFISPFKVDKPITDHVSQVQDNSHSESLTTPVSKHITPENHIPQQTYVTPGSLTSPEPVTSLTFKDSPILIYDYLKEEDSSGLNVSNVDSNITDPDLTPGCFEIECVFGLVAKDEYRVSLFKCDNCKDIVCDKCCKDGAHRGHQKYLKPNNNG